MEQFDFTEWSDWRLNEKFTDLLENRMIPHGEQRAKEQARYMAHLIFELDQRQSDE